MARRSPFFPERAPRFHEHSTTRTPRLRAPHNSSLIAQKLFCGVSSERRKSCASISNKLRFFAGLTNDEAARALGIPERTAWRHWGFARAWLYRELRRLEDSALPRRSRSAGIRWRHRDTNEI